MNFCYASIGDRQLAEDCTQEVFLTLSRKMHSLRLDTNVPKWLYRTAKLEIKRCLRKNKHKNISIEDVPEIPQAFNENLGLFEEILTEEEYSILNKYYLYGEDISKLAEERNLSVKAMYQRIHRIKKKIIKNSDKLHNLFNE
ncbi:MAG: sigma-70 family RNA polymerase sigma factor [Ruminococcus flavefaciens]|nr:sigma-70 family RNA polymerase sigma factor [Ruminococcus flavefaciens]